uniref:Syndecan n=1 Tax=Zonotrichia albicollis TaxID=44394 RepID=A0A8D2NA04_ZONAL
SQAQPGARRALTIPASLWSQAQRWRNENFERPVDLEGSGDDDPFGEDELDDIYSGSGSGCEYWEMSLDEPFSPARGSWAPWKPKWWPREAFGAHPSLAICSEGGGGRLGSSRAKGGEGGAQPGQGFRLLGHPGCAPHPGDPALPPSERLPQAGGQRCRIPGDTATVLGVRCHVPAPAPRRESQTLLNYRLMVHFQPIGCPEQEFQLHLAFRAPQGPFAAALTERWTPDKEPEVPASSGPSGDFEIREEEETTRPDLGNEVVAVVTPPAGPGPGRNVETGLLDNTIDSGNSAAQLPQKNILERKEVLIAVIVGGVVGALFAAFLVMLLIYRMKKKDEGSYTLEEPKQANVTYQKPDKQEEFYA